MALRTSFVTTLALRALYASAVQLKQSERTDLLPDVQNDTVDELIYTRRCARGYQCGVLGEMVQPPIRVSCPQGDMYFAHDALYIPSKKGRSLVYCSIPKVATSYMFFVMAELKMETQHGPRNSGYLKVHEVVGNTGTEGTDEQREDLCNAYSFLIIRNPWDRIVSGYIDKVASKRLMSKPPNFAGFMKRIQRANSSELNHHFRPASLLCSTTGERAQKYHKVIKLEGNIQGNLEYVFHNEFGLPRGQVRQVLEAGISGGASHNTSTSGYVSAAWEKSGLERTSFYFGQSDPHIVEEIFEDDIAFGNYKFVGKNKKLLK